MDTNETTNEELVALALDELSGAKRGEVETAIRSSGDAARRYQLIRGLIQQLHDARQDLGLFHVDAGQRERLLALMQGRDKSWLTAAARAREVIATLIFDSLSMGRVALGFRGGGAPRHLIFESEGVEIDLRVSPRQELRARGAALRFDLIGQIQGRSSASEVVARRRSDGATSSIPISGDGVFEGELIGGEYELSFVLPENDVVIPCVDLSSHEHDDV